MEHTPRRWGFMRPGDQAITHADSYDDAATRARELADHSYGPVDVAYNDGDGWFLAEVIVAKCPPMRSVAFVRPGTTIRHPTWRTGDPEVLDVTAVSSPDGDGMVTISHTGGSVRVNAEMLADVVTPESADMVASVVLDEQMRWL